MRKVERFPLPKTARNTNLRVPAGTEFMQALALMDSEPYLYGLVDSNQREMETRQIMVCHTNFDQLPDQYGSRSQAVYLGTITVGGGSRHMHVFEIIDLADSKEEEAEPEGPLKAAAKTG